MAKSFSSASRRPSRDPVLVALFRETGQRYDQGVLDLGAKIKASLTAVLDARAARRAKSAAGPGKGEHQKVGG